MGKVVGVIASILAVSAFIISFVPFISPETKAYILVCLVLPLALFSGGAGVIFIQNLLIRVIVGVAAAAIILALIKALLQILPE